MHVFEILQALTNSSQRVKSCNKNFASVIRDLLSFSAPTFRFEVFFTKNRCLLTVLKCLMSILERCPSYWEFNYSKMTEKWPGPTQGVRLKELCIKRELTVFFIELCFILESCDLMNR